MDYERLQVLNFLKHYNNKVPRPKIDYLMVQQVVLKYFMIFLINY